MISDVRRRSGQGAFDYATAFVREATRDKENVLELIAPGDAGPAKTLGCRIEKDGSVTHYFLIADDRHDKLYLLFFESPMEEWEVAWKTGEQILKQIRVVFPADPGN